MNKLPLRLSLTLMIAFACSRAACADTPEQIVRQFFPAQLRDAQGDSNPGLYYQSAFAVLDKGTPKEEQWRLALPSNSPPQLLTVVNGEENGRRVSAARIRLNGVDVVTPNELNQGVASLSKQILLGDANQVGVLLDGKPGSFVVLLLRPLPAQSANP